MFSALLSLVTILLVVVGIAFQVGAAIVLARSA
jgi:hypothetical protein